MPHIRARDQASAFFALGYVHARDRLWQLHYWRCLAEGRVSDLVGNSGLASDGFFRAASVAALCARIAGQQPDGPFRRRLRAYAAGVSRYVEEVRRGRHPLPREFRLTHTQPEPWSEVASVELLFLQGANLDFGTGAEVTAAWVRQHGLAELRRRWALSVGDLPYVTVPPASGGRRPAPEGGSRGAGGAPGGPGPGSLGAAPAAAGSSAYGERLGLWGPGASNVFAVGASRTAAGRPILANDTHLAHVAPSQWYAAVLEVPDTLVAAGFTVPGLPVVTAGRNREVAWGETSLGADVCQVVAESLSADGWRVRRAGGWEPVREVPLGLRYRIGPLRIPLLWVKARTTSRGVLFLEERRAHRAYAVDWFALHPVTYEMAAVEPELARTAQEAVDAFRNLPTPGLNLLAADRAGHLAYRAVGRVPRRVAPPDPLPLAGADPGSEWPAEIPADSMPAAADPAQDYFVNSNNRPAGPEYPYPLGDYFMEYRARRVDELIRAGGRLDAAAVERVQLDEFSPQWRRFAARFLGRIAGRRLSAEAEAARAALAAYDGRPESLAVGPTVFRVWYAQTRSRLGAVGSDGFLDAVLDGRAGPATPGSDSTWGGAFSGLLATTLEGAVRRLHQVLGPMGPAWAWGRAHRAHFEHPLERRYPEMAPPEVWVAGDNQSVNVASLPLGRLPRVTFGPSMRVVADLSQDSTVLLVVPPGNSGDPDSPHYADQLGAWAAGRYFRVRLGPPRPEELESVIHLDLPGPP